MKFAISASALILAANLQAYAAPITYSLSQSVGTYTANGTVTTDGVIGTVATPDITSFSFAVSNGSSTNSFSFVKGSSSGTNGQLFLFGTDLTASATALTFNFSGVDGGGLAVTDSTASNLLCFVATGNVCVLNVPGNVVIGVNAVYVGNPTPATGSQVIGRVQTTAVTPEPSSLLLLGTGAFGAFATFRRRVFTR